MREKSLSDTNFKNMPKERHIELSRKGGINSGKSRRRIRLLSKIVDTWIMDAIKAVNHDLDEIINSDAMQDFDNKMNAVLDANIEELEKLAEKMINELESVNGMFD